MKGRRRNSFKASKRRNSRSAPPLFFFFTVRLHPTLVPHFTLHPHTQKKKKKERKKQSQKKKTRKQSGSVKQRLHAALTRNRTEHIHREQTIPGSRLAYWSLAFLKKKSNKQLTGVLLENAQMKMSLPQTRACPSQDRNWKTNGRKKKKRTH